MITVNKSGSSSRLEIRRYQIELYDNNISSLPVMRLGHNGGRITTPAVYFKHPFSEHERQFVLNTGNGVFYINSKDSQTQSTLMTLGRQSDDYSINAYRNILINGSVVFASDRRIKKNIRPNQKNSLAIIDSMKIYQYEYKRRGEGETTGFIAQQLKKEVDAIYGTDFVGEHDELTSVETYGLKDGERCLNVKKDKLYPHLVAAIQELSKRNEALENTVIKMKKKIAKLEDKIEDESNHGLNKRLFLLEKMFKDSTISSYFK